MSARGPYRRHSQEFKLQLCSDIRDGKLGRREAQKTYRISANLIQLWLIQNDNGELDREEAAVSTIAEYEAKITAQERKIGQPTMELDLVKKPRVQGPRAPTSRHCPSAPLFLSVRRGQVINLPRSTYYYRSTAANTGLTGKRLIDLVGDIQDEFLGYCYRSVTGEFKERGHVVNSRKRFGNRGSKEDGLAVLPNLYRNVTPVVPDRVWVADITFIRISRGFVFLAAILDACSRKVVGYGLSQHIDTELTLTFLACRYAPAQSAGGTCIRHTDQCSQYASARYRAALENYWLIGSMSSVGNP